MGAADLCELTAASLTAPPQLQRSANEYAEEIDFTVPSGDSMDFAIRLFDLNQVRR